MPVTKRLEEYASTPELKALLSQANDNAHKIAQQQAAFSRSIPGIKTVLSELRREIHLASSFENIEHNLTTQFILQDFLFRLLLNQKNDAAFKWALRVQSKAVRIHAARAKIRDAKKYIDEQTSKNDKQTSIAPSHHSQTPHFHPCFRGDDTERHTVEKRDPEPSITSGF